MKKDFAAGGALLAKIDSTGTKYYHQDHLSNRMVTNSTGGVAAEMGHFPFGESWYNATNDKLLFTTYERDAESGNHYAMARYHISRLGRLSSPDPLAGSAASPQSLNRYSYSINDPANVTDPSGALPNCNTAETNPKDKSQQASGDGPSDTGDEGADAAMQSGCPGSHTNPDGGGSWADSLGLDGTLDGGFVGDDSGGLPSGDFGVGQSTPGGIDVASQVALLQMASAVTGYLLVFDLSDACVRRLGDDCARPFLMPWYGNAGLLNALVPGTPPSGPGDQNGNGNGQQKPQSQQKPCPPSGYAPSPQQYQAMGYVARASWLFGPEVGGLSNAGALGMFKRGMPLDAQVLYGGSQAYGNYAYGVFMGAAGYSLNFALWGANAYASSQSSYPNKTPMDSNYPSLPAANVTNITNGYNAQKNGELCSTGKG